MCGHKLTNQSKGLKESRPDVQFVIKTQIARTGANAIGLSNNTQSKQKSITCEKVQNIYKI